MLAYIPDRRMQITSEDSNGVSMTIYQYVDELFALSLLGVLQLDCVNSQVEALVPFSFSSRGTSNVYVCFFERECNVYVLFHVGKMCCALWAGLEQAFVGRLARGGLKKTIHPVRFLHRNDREKERRRRPEAPVPGGGHRPIDLFLSRFHRFELFSLPSRSNLISPLFFIAGLNPSCSFSP